MSTDRSKVIDSLVAEHIRAFRKKRGLSQSDLAKALGVTFQQIQKYEKGVNRIGAGRLFELAQLFNVPVQALYPDSRDSAERDKVPAEELKAMSDFVLSADGWRLCNAFLRLNDPQKRKKIIALVQEIVES